MEIINCQQGTPEWDKARLGIITASCFGDVLAKGQGKTRRAYMLRVAAERLTGEKQETYSNGAMEWGKENEPKAREYYQELNGCFVQEVGFVKLNDFIGCSPDGLVEEDGIIEIKCPYTTTHLETVLSNEVPTCYIPQIQGQLWITGRQWCDFISFDPRVSGRPLWCKRVFRDKDYIANLQSETNIFADQLNELVKQFEKTEF
ncbi:MAG: lambda exonuclease family protein [Candidatus Micrarchaeia archaeon]|jgi:putative phage-type endonuclease